VCRALVEGNIPLYGLERGSEQRVFRVEDTDEGTIVEDIHEGQL